MKKYIMLALIAGSSAQVFSQTPKAKKVTTEFNYLADRFADVQVLRYEVKGFDSLNLKQKQLAYYLYKAALSGRDIIYDQKYAQNLRIRKTLEAIYVSFKGNKLGDNWVAFDQYLKQVWFSNGIHHHYASDKIAPHFTRQFFFEELKKVDVKTLPLVNGQTVEMLGRELEPSIFDLKVDAMTVNLADGIDHVKGSANNFYEGVSEKEVEQYYERMARDLATAKLLPTMPKDMQLDPRIATPTIDPRFPVEVSPDMKPIPMEDKTPISFGLNSKLVNERGMLTEKVWKSGGMYGAAIDQIIYWLKKAQGVAENPQQAKVLGLLVKFYQTGDLVVWDEYNIEWVKDTKSTIDVVNGFIEVYQDAMGKRGSFESVVSIKDFEATKRIDAIAKKAQWFEDNSPLMEIHKKKEVKGIIGKVINVVVESGDAAPSTPIGINLPNSNWIRQMHGSKSVSLGNIVESYNLSSATSPVGAEFAYNAEALARAKKYGALAGELHTDMHEVIGHASGQINPGVGTPDVTLKNYQNALEEARADLVALYYILDPKLVEIGVMPDLECGKAEYDNYILNGLMLQLNRVEEGKNLEEAHMRNRQLVAKWAYEKGMSERVIELEKRGNKTYIKINDYTKLRGLFGQLLREIQRVKSEGDYEAGKGLIENYGVKVDPELHREVKQRFAKLNVAAYKGFIQPKLTPIMKDGKIIDVKVTYPNSFAEQMLEYSKEYGFLPYKN
jgi:dipeptidyl-peptidase-3